jgi:hypothetical protein
MSLPQSDDLTSLVLRTDFTDDAGWEALRSALGDHATCVSDPAFAGTTVHSLVAADAAATEEDRIFSLFLADGGEDLLAVDLADEPGRTFRLPVDRFADMSANLSIGNMDFADFAD